MMQFVDGNDPFGSLKLSEDTKKYIDIKLRNVKVTY